DPLITISASGFQSAAFKGLTEDRTRSRAMAQKLLALRAATTEAPRFVDVPRIGRDAVFA
ncbi:hypothetical protein MRS76_25855, partial [Rhizobiaceae bacterium n13]|uniref:hypothetical protein n=1 Tax=Ferirhizobium litorale TaxID=2927786 RepID=UPI0024B29DC5